MTFNMWTRLHNPKRYRKIFWFYINTKRSIGSIVMTSFVFSLTWISFAMESLLQQIPGPQQVHTLPPRQWRKWSRSTLTFWAPWLGVQPTAASGSGCWLGNVESTSFEIRNASLSQQPPSFLLTWCISTRAWGCPWAPWSVAGIREALVSCWSYVLLGVDTTVGQG